MSGVDAYYNHVMCTCVYCGSILYVWNSLRKPWHIVTDYSEIAIT